MVVLDVENHYYFECDGVPGFVGARRKHLVVV